ncbi:tyrosine-type recombinase/integrase [Aliihoeflea aestuarii]|uniref:tyrosine-type recombinase/integrase n=1 Tax=Aliihoeflea aestuarii TaxID=453840 RepID=UPI0020926CED|nr:tyrosine-type recombinase/integrase [Aliihoeflea aestuarii]
MRFRKGLFSAYLSGILTDEAREIAALLKTADFWQAYESALKGLDAATSAIGAKRARPGSVAALILSFYRSPEFLGLSEATKATYRGILDRFARLHGEDPVKLLQRQHIKAIIGGMSDRPHAANNLLRLLRLVLDFAVDIELIPTNAARGLKGFRVKAKGFATWSEADIAAFEARHPIGSRARLAMALMLYTGQRRGDVVRLGWQHVDGSRIAVQQNKTGQALKITMHAALLDALAHAPRTNMTFLITEFGAPFTPAGFGNWFREQCDSAGLKGLSAHGLRKAAARRLADAGNSTKRIQAITGHKTLKEVERYTLAADQQRLADEAVKSMPDRSDREQNFPNLGERLDKQASKRLK